MHWTTLYYTDLNVAEINTASVIYQCPNWRVFGSELYLSSFQSPGMLFDEDLWALAKGDETLRQVPLTFKITFKIIFFFFLNWQCSRLFVRNHSAFTVEQNRLTFWTRPYWNVYVMHFTLYMWYWISFGGYSAFSAQLFQNYIVTRKATSQRATRTKMWNSVTSLKSIWDNFDLVVFNLGHSEHLSVAISID